MLCRAAYALGQLVGAGLLTQNTPRPNSPPPPYSSAPTAACTPCEIACVITAGLTAGARNPRRTTPRTSYQGAA
jgi:hypothetical protein